MQTARLIMRYEAPRGLGGLGGPGALEGRAGSRPRALEGSQQTALPALSRQDCVSKEQIRM